MGCGSFAGDSRAGLRSSPPRTSPVAAHRGEVAVPYAAPGQLEDPAGLGAPDEVRKSPLHGRRVRPFSAQALRLAEQPRIEHKTRAFHVYDRRAEWTPRSKSRLFRTGCHTPGGARATHDQHAPVNERSRDQETLRAQLEAHHGEGWSWALACCRGDSTRAEDALQASCMKILDGRARFDERSSFKTWLFGVIRLTAVDQRRRDWRRWLRWAPLSEAEHRLVAVDGRARDERCDEVREALAGLGERQAQVLRLVFYHGLTLDEAAKAMGVSPGTARTHYERGAGHGALAGAVGAISGGGGPRFLWPGPPGAGRGDRTDRGAAAEAPMNSRMNFGRPR